MSVKKLTRTTATSTAAVAKRASELVVEYLPAIIGRVVEVDKASSLKLNITVKPAGRTEAAKDPEVIITATPNYGDKVVRIRAKLTGEGDDAQLSLIQEMVTEIPENPDFNDEEVQAAEAAAAK